MAASRMQDPSRCIDKNVGPADRLARAVILAALWMWPLATRLPVVVTELAGLVGGALLVTVITGHCVVYSLLHWSTGPAAPRI